MAPPGTARRVQLTLLSLLVLAAIGLLAGWTGSRFGLDGPTVGIASSWAAMLILGVVPVRISAVVSEVFPGPAEPLFQLATDIKLSLQVSGNPQGRRLMSQTGQPGQPGSTYVTESSGAVLTTTVVSSDPPRRLVTTISSRLRLNRVDMTRTYTPVPEGTVLEARIRQRMPLFAWLLRPVVRRQLEAEVAQANARIKDYLRSMAASVATER